MSRKVINGIIKESTDVRINGIADFFATEGAIVVNGQEHYDFFRRYGVSASNLILWLDQAAITAGISLASWDDLSWLGNDMKQATTSYQPSLSNTFMKDAARDFDGSDNFMAQEVMDSKVTDVSYTTENSDKTITDSGQDFSDWETTSGNAAYMVVVTDDDSHISWAYLGVKVSATEIKVYSDIARTTSAWKGDGGTGTPASYEILKTDFQITAALSVFMWVKPDDGHPAANSDLISKYRDVDGFRSWTMNNADDGIISIDMSSDGIWNNTYEYTDTAFFSNGQETWHHIGFVYNGTTVVIYGDGVALDSTTSVGIPAALYDVSEKLTIGALSTPAYYFAGLIGPVVVASRAYSAGEVSRLFHADRAKFGV